MRIRRYIVSLIALVTIGAASLPVVAPSLAFADAKAQVCEGLGGSSSGGNCNTGGTSVGKVIKFAVELLSVIAGIAGVIMILIGGFKYITSGGDSNGIASAKNTIIYAIVGLIVAALAQVIAQFVLGSVT